MAMENTFHVKESKSEDSENPENFEKLEDFGDTKEIENMEEVEKSFKEKYFRLLKAHYDLMDTIYGKNRQ
jgi:hypothetical protein